MNDDVPPGMNMNVSGGVATQSQPLRTLKLSGYTVTSAPAPLAELLMPAWPAAPVVPPTRFAVGSPSLVLAGVAETSVGNAVTFVPNLMPCWLDVAFARCEHHARKTSKPGIPAPPADGLRWTSCGAATTVWLSPLTVYSRAMIAAPSTLCPRGIRISALASRNRSLDRFARRCA